MIIFLLFFSIGFSPIHAATVATISTSSLTQWTAVETAGAVSIETHQGVSCVKTSKGAVGDAWSVLGAISDSVTIASGYEIFWEGFTMPDYGAGASGNFIYGMVTSGSLEIANMGGLYDQNAPQYLQARDGAEVGSVNLGADVHVEFRAVIGGTSPSSTLVMYYRLSGGDTWIELGDLGTGNIDYIGSSIEFMINHYTQSMDYYAFCNNIVITDDGTQTVISEGGGIEKDPINIREIRMGNQ